MKTQESKPSKVGCAASLLLALLAIALQAEAGALASRHLSGVVVTRIGESVEGVTVIARYPSGEQRAVTDQEGRFQFTVPDEPLTLRVEGKHVAAYEKTFRQSEPTEDLQVEIEFVIPRIHESMVITAAQLDPSIDRRNDAVYKSALFSRDDQLFQTLDAGINTGQHEGGGKSLEIRRFSYNLDHGGASGGLKVLVDNVQQNHVTQGHGQGYLGQLKSLTPELVQEVDILNGPFNAEYGDFSGLGVVHIRLRESLADLLTLRIQGGSFASFRTFAGYSPELNDDAAFIAYEGSRTRGPFISPLRYSRDNLTGNYTLRLSQTRAVGFKLNAGRNDFFSSGQIPLDEVAAGRLDRFGFIDPDNGGNTRSATLGVLYRSERESGGVLKLDGFLSRSLFDLYSNFTFYLNDEENGDEIQQHDSRLQSGINLQYLRPHKLFGQASLFNAGASFHENRINLGLYNTVSRNPTGNVTKANAHVTNTGIYVQQGFDSLRGRLHLNAGLRFDHFRFDVENRLIPALSGARSASRFQPKANLAFTPSDKLPLTLYANYGRGISSQDARGVVERPEAPRVATTDFYQAGASHRLSRISLSADVFFIDRSNEQVYVPDDGSIEFNGPSRAYGFEVKSSVRLNRLLNINGGFTNVINAFYRGTSPRVYLSRAPHFVSNAGLTLTGWQQFTGSLRFRYINSYILDGEDTTLRASGLTVLDLSVARRIRPWMDFNLSIDNLTDKQYWETQNYFESRIAPGAPIRARIHATPGYPITLTVGLTFRLLGK